MLELLREIAPGVTRVAVLRDPTNPALLANFAAVRGAAHVLGVDVSAIDTRDAGQIERGVAAFARSPNGGLIIMPGAWHRFMALWLSRLRRGISCPQSIRSVTT